MNLIESVENQYKKTDIPEFSPGDIVRVNTRIREGQKERIQAYEGTVIRRAHGGTSATLRSDASHLVQEVKGHSHFIHPILKVLM